MVICGEISVYESCPAQPEQQQLRLKRRCRRRTDGGAGRGIGSRVDEFGHAGFIGRATVIGARIVPNCG